MNNINTATENTFIITFGGMVVVNTSGQYVRGFDEISDLFGDDDSDYCDNAEQFLLCSSKEEAEAVIAQLPASEAFDYFVMSAAEWQQRTGCDYLADRIYTALENQQ